MEDTWTRIDARSGDYTGVKLTPAQARTLDAIRSRLPYFDFCGRPVHYEVKQFELSQAAPDPETAAIMASLGMHARHPDVYVNIITGMKGDDGTMAEVYCRKYRHLKIGPRGGIEATGNKRKGFRPVSLFDALNREYWT